MTENSEQMAGGEPTRSDFHCTLGNLGCGPHLSRSNACVSVKDTSVIFESKQQFKSIFTSIKAKVPHHKYKPFLLALFVKSENIFDFGRAVI